MHIDTYQPDWACYFLRRFYLLTSFMSREKDSPIPVPDALAPAFQHVSTLKNSNGLNQKNVQKVGILTAA